MQHSQKSIIFSDIKSLHAVQRLLGGVFHAAVHAYYLTEHTAGFAHLPFAAITDSELITGQFHVFAGADRFQFWDASTDAT